MLLVTMVMGVALATGTVAIQARSQPSSPNEQGRVRVSGPRVPQTPEGDSERVVQVLAAADVCWEMQLVDLGVPVEYCGKGGVDLPSGFGASRPQGGVRITKTRGVGPLTVTVYDGRVEVKRAQLSNVNDSVELL